MSGPGKVRSTRSASLATPAVERPLFDNSLSVLNRTGAWHIARDLCQEFVPQHAQVRYWRLGEHAPEGLARKLAARLMMVEINWLRDSSWCLIGSKVIEENTRVFLDPLFVLRSKLTERDIVLCHDVGPLSHSSLYDARTVENYRTAYEKIRKHGPAIVFVSEWSRNSFISLYGLNFRFLATIPLYVRAGLFEGPLEALPGLTGLFFLTVGAFETRKNHIAALEAYRDGGFYQRGIRYVLCGSRGEGHGRIIEFAKSVPGVVMPGYVPDSQLRWLYAHAEAFVLPSLLEGFGMPALEAAYMGLLPIVSEGSALVEAVEGVCLQVPPRDAAAIGEAMRHALSRTSAEKAETSHRLREVAARASKECFLQKWRELLIER
jgi:glycosyltransferase involved in cell wall biosynthesis